MSLHAELKSRLREAPITDSQVKNAKPDNSDTTAKVPTIANKDPIINASKGSAGSSMRDIVESNDTQNKVLDIGDTFTDEVVNITEVEKNNFLDAILNNTRYTQRIELFGGKINIVVRSRTAEESEAIAAWINHNISRSKFDSVLDYSITVRNAILAAQVAEINGVRFDELREPLFAKDNAGEIINPGWLDDANAWRDKPEPLILAIYEAVKLFEKKYWTLTTHANDQDFWRPVGSTLV